MAIQTRALLALALLFGLLSSFAIPVNFSQNADPRLALTFALVDQRRVVIDDYALGLGDFASFQGHTYSDKAPLASVLAAVPYGTLRFLGAPAHTGSASTATGWRYTFAHLVQLPVALLLALVFYRKLRRHLGAKNAYLATAALLLATPLGFYVVNYWGAALGASLVFLAIAFKHHPVRFGLLLGLAVSSEYALAPVALVLTLGLFASRLQLLKRVFVGVLPAAIFIGVYNWLCFGSPFDIGYAHIGNPTFSGGMAEGLVGITWPNLGHLLNLWFSPQRGLFFMAPWLLLAFVPPYRRSQLVILLAFALGSLLISGYAFWFGGVAWGPRHLIWSVPLLAYLAALRIASYRKLLLLPGFVLGVIGTTLSPYLRPEAGQSVWEGALDALAGAETWSSALDLPTAAPFLLSLPLVLWCLSAWSKLPQTET